MTVQTLKLGGKPYVIVPADEFRRAMERLASFDAEERRDAAIVRKRLKTPRKRLVPLAKVKAELGL